MSPFDFSVIVPKLRQAIEEYIKSEEEKGVTLPLKDAVITWMDKHYEHWFHAHVGIPLLDVQAGAVLPASVKGDVAGEGEKRRHRRIPVEISAYYRVLWTPHGKSDEETGTNSSGDIKNISAGGLYIVTGRPYPISTLLEIQFELPGIDGVISAFAMVAWRQERSFGRYGHGLHFSHIEAFSTNFLDEAIMEKLLDAPVICLDKNAE